MLAASILRSNKSSLCMLLAKQLELLLIPGMQTPQQSPSTKDLLFLMLSNKSLLLGSISLIT